MRVQIILLQLHSEASFQRVIAVRVILQREFLSAAQVEVATDADLELTMLFIKQFSQYFFMFD